MRKRNFFVLFSILILLFGLSLTLIGCQKEDPEDEYDEPTGDEETEHDEWPNEVYYEGFERADLSAWKLNDAVDHQEPYYETNQVTGQFITKETSKVVEGEQAIRLMSRPGFDAKTEQSIPDITRALLTFNMMLDTPDGEMSLEIQDNATDRLFSVHLMPSGKIAYRDNIPDGAGYGHRIETNATWEANKYVSIMIAWYETYKYEAFVKINGGWARFTPAGGVPFFDTGNPLIPAKVKLRVNRPDATIGNTWKHSNGYFDYLVIQDLSKMEVPPHTVIEGADDIDPTKIAVAKAGNILNRDEAFKFDLNVTADRAEGKLYYALVEKDTPALSAADIKAGNDASILVKGSLDVNNIQISTSITVPEQKPYTLQLVIESPQGFSAVSVVDVIPAIEVTDIEELYSALRDKPNDYIILANDINAENYLWEPTNVTFRGTLDGKGHWIHNLTIIGGTGSDFYGGLVSTSKDGATFKDINFNKVRLFANTTDCGLLAGKGYSTLVDNIHIYDMITHVNGDYDYQGAFIGRAYQSVEIYRSSADYTLETEIMCSYSGGAIGGIEANAEVTIEDVYLNVKANLGEQTFGGVVGRTRGTLTLNRIVVHVDATVPKKSSYIIGEVSDGSGTVTDVIFDGTLTPSEIGANAVIGSGGNYTFTNVFGIAIPEAYSAVAVEGVSFLASIDETWVTTNLTNFDLDALWSYQAEPKDVIISVRLEEIPDAPEPTVEPMNPQDQVDEVAAGLEVVEEAINNLTLPTSDPKYNTTITWVSSKPQYIANDGTVTRPTAAVGDQEVTLTATVTLVVNEITYESEVTFYVTVIAEEETIPASFSLDASIITIGTYKSPTKYNNFTILANDSQGVDVDENSKTFGTTSHSRRIKLGGTGIAGPGGYRAIMFTTVGPGTLTVHALSSSSGTVRDLVLSDGTNEIGRNSIDGTLCAIKTYEITTAGTYYLLSASGGINIYYLSFEMEATGFSWNVSNEDAAEITTNTKYGEFTVLASAGKNVLIEGNNKTFGDMSHTMRLKLNGTGTPGAEGNRAIMFTVTGPGTLTVHAISGSSSATRNLLLSNGDSVVGSNAIKGDVAEIHTYEITSAGTYYLYSENSSINIYYLAFQPN